MGDENKHFSEEKLCDHLRDTPTNKAILHESHV